MDNEPDPPNPDDTIGYATTRPMTEPFGLALNYWDGGFEWIAYHEPHESSFTASAAMPTYDKTKPKADWVDALFFAEIFTDVPNKRVKVTLKDTRIVLAGGSLVPLSVMDGKYSLATGSDADLNGWYRAELKFDRSKLPASSAKFDGARIETTLVSNMSFTSPEDKADYYIQLCHEKYDPIKATNIILNLHNDYLGKSFVGDHWETRWMDAQYKDYVDRRFAAIWKQIAEYFKNYPRKLTFETCNEPTMSWYNGVEEGYYLKPEETYLSEISYFFRQAKQRGIPVLWWEDYYSINDYNKDDLEHLGRIYWLYNKETDQWQRTKILRTIKNAVK